MTPSAFAAWREGLSLTQHAAAQKLNLTLRTVQRYEDGSSPVPTTVSQACAYWELRQRVTLALMDTEDRSKP